MGCRTIEALQIVLPLIKDITKRDMQLALSDRTTVLDVWPAMNFNMPAEVPGDTLDRNNHAHNKLLEVMESGERNVSCLEKEVFGIPIMSILTPVYEDGEVVGIVACAYSMEHQSRVQESVEMLDTNLTQSRDSVEEIAQQAVNLAEMLNRIQEVSGEVRTEVEKASDMVKAIQSNASRSNILALNASIEAARAGEAGRGFAVVANEMGKLAQVSGSSAKEISQSLTGIFEAFAKVDDAVNDANDAASTQAATTQEITAALADVTSSVGEIIEYAKKAD